MTQKFLEIVKSCGIDLAAPISLRDCRILRQHKLMRAELDSPDRLFACMIAVPYLTKHRMKNLSAYAIPRDYHGYFNELFARLIPLLKEEFPNYRFAGFADDSPIDERDAAARAGLGVIGVNGMLITEKYSSYVFLGEIITDLPLDCRAKEIQRCYECGSCKSACPMMGTGECLSSLTQKKGTLSATEREMIKLCGSVWGCDVCQEVCPYTESAIERGTIYTDVDYFKCDLVELLTSERLNGMTDEEFSLRAYSWRGRQTIERNLRILEED